MKLSKFLALAVFALLFSQCKSSQPTGPTASAPSLGQVALILDTTQSVFLKNAVTTNGKPHPAIMLTAAWLKAQPTVESADVLDSTYIYITLKAGLTCLYYLEEVDSAGMSLTRGGGPPGNVVLQRTAQHGASTLATNTITNKSVLIFAPVYHEFYKLTGMQNVLDLFSKSSLDLNVTVVKDSECTTDVVDKFGNYGLVIIDTHGLPNGFMIGTTIPSTYTSFAAEDTALLLVNTGALGIDNFQAGTIMLARGLVVPATTPPPPYVYSPKPFKVVLTTKYLSSLPQMPNTVVFGNMCYSGQSIGPVPGWPTPIARAFTNLKPISYYGYAYSSGSSAPVSNEFSKEMEDSLVTALVLKTDSTGHAHLQSDGSEYFDAIGLYHYSTEDLYLKHFAASDYSYAKCIDSFTDARDGHLYHAVCIGGQNWMKENLDYDVTGSECYDSLSSYCDKYGKLYDRALVMNGSANSSANPSGVQGICPKGWHVPSNAEWMQLINFLGGTNTAGGAMKSTTGWSPDPKGGATNKSGFSALPAGEWVHDNYATTGRYRSFFSLGTFTAFHTATQSIPNQVDYMALWNDTTKAAVLTGPPIPPTITEDNVSCRCVKDP